MEQSFLRLIPLPFQVKHSIWWCRKLVMQIYLMRKVKIHIECSATKLHQLIQLHIRPPMWMTVTVYCDLRMKKLLGTKIT